MRLPRMRLPERYTVTVVIGSLILLTIFVMRDSLSDNIYRMRDASRMFKPKMPTAEEFRKSRDVKTGNPLIDNYGQNNPLAPGENGRGVAFESGEQDKVKAILEEHRVNTRASDMIPLNRLVPDSRFKDWKTSVGTIGQDAIKTASQHSDALGVNVSSTTERSRQKILTSVTKEVEKSTVYDIFTTMEALRTTEQTVTYDFFPSKIFKTKTNSETTALKMPTLEEFRQNNRVKTGNPLLDDYGQNDPHEPGENGRGVDVSYLERDLVKSLMEKHHVNTRASDVIPLNRLLPDSRFPECSGITYSHDLPTASVIIPFFNEWPSILLRTVYSVINRTPRHLLEEILLLDDNSTMIELKGKLSSYVDSHFPAGLVKLVRMPGRVGLIKARQIGWKMAKGDVIVIFDSHMEVNTDWLQPLLTEIKKDRKTVALGTLDYILPEDMHYTWHDNYVTRYGFDWRLIFFETYFRPDQFGANNQDPKPGTVMVGTAYAMDRKYFGEVGGFDEKMKVWGGENLELAWRVWMCGGRLIHLPCSKVGHIARVQPYKFPEGRRETEMFNYKRIIDVWMDPTHRKFVHDYFPEMKTLDVGDLSDRLALKQRLGCKNFTWFLETHWPELNVYDENALAWGSAQNPATKYCLDNHQYLFQAPQPLYADPCHFHYATQGFTWTKQGLLKTSLQCVVVHQSEAGDRPLLQDCIIGSRDQWSHTKAGFLEHVGTRLCMALDSQGPIMRPCSADDPSQRWEFNHYNLNLK